MRELRILYADEASEDTLMSSTQDSEEFLVGSH
jgi:hypothetical protein